MSEGIFAAVDAYVAERFVPKDSVLEETLSTMRKAGMPEINVTPNQGKLLHLLARLGGARRILEIGTLGGYSAIWLARALPEEGRLISLELDETYAEVARENIRGAGLSRIAAVRTGPGLASLREMIDQREEPFDFIFIDADKPLYLQYFQFSLSLSHRGTLIVADNVIREGKVLERDPSDEKVEGVQRLLDYLATTDRATTTLLQTVGAKGHDGMVLSIV
ncbi:MAG: O-methyltransferase, partial [Spirochaetaceae bacterium]